MLTIKLNKWGAILVGMASLLIFLPPAAAEKTPPKCKYKQIYTSPSPDNRWDAFVQEEYCNDGAYVRVVNNIVQLVRRGTLPVKENSVLAIDSGGSPKNLPSVSWISPNILQITVPNKSLIGLKRNRFEDIKIAVKYEPDDPKERERFLRGLGLKPE